ncbi:MAG: Cas9 inhibitor AcrIIA9 family protein [Bacillota bacterium]|nr:Cas9 inhibitor AcrIIA9 family protein [Bacillota bacterium]
MINKAIAKITDEMMKIDTPLAIGIEEHLTEACRNENVAAKLLDNSKSLKVCCDKVTAEARKRAKNNVYAFPAEEVYAMVDEYYGISNVHEPAQRINVMDLL